MKEKKFKAPSLFWHMCKLNGKIQQWFFLNKIFGKSNEGFLDNLLNLVQNNLYGSMDVMQHLQILLCKFINFLPIFLCPFFNLFLNTNNLYKI